MRLSTVLRRGRRSRTSAALPLVLAFFVIPAANAAPGTIDFDEAIAQALRTAPLLDARAAHLSAAREEAAQAAALPDPELIVGVDNLPVTGSRPLDPSASDMTMKKIGVMQAFPARAKREARRTVAESLVERTRALSTIEQLEVRQQAAEAWFALWVAQRELATLKTLGGQAELAVRLAEARLRNGTGTAVDAMAAKAAALEVDNRVDAARTRVASARARLARWLGRDAGVPEAGDAPDFRTLAIPEAVLLASVDRQRRPIDWRSREAVAEARLAEAIADKRPDWSVMAAYGQRGDGRDDMLMVEVRIGLPLFSRNRQDRLVAARRADLQAAAAEREDAVRAQREAVQAALAEWHGLRAQVERHEAQILPLAKDRAAAALASYAAGGALQPWLEARRDELEAHLMHLRGIGELARTWTSLAYLLPAEEAFP